MKKEFRSFKFEVKQADQAGDVGFIKGYASTFGNIDQGMDVVEKGAFARTIQNNKGRFPILLDHWSNTPAGWNIEASEDDYGLKVEGEIYLETEQIRHRYKMAKRAQELGTKMGLSIGYSVIKDEADFNNPRIRRLKELKLWEYSLVVFPMNEEASVTAAKASHFARLFEVVQKSGYDLNKLEKALLAEGVRLDGQELASKESDPELLHSLDKLLKTISA